MDMEFWIAALAVWLGLLYIVVRARIGWSDAKWARAIAFAPTEEVSGHQLFGHLLGANLVLLEHDDFNQLASALPPRRIREIMARYWNVHSPLDFHQVITRRLRRLGASSPEEAQAFEAWRTGTRLDTPSYHALRDVLKFLSAHAGVVPASEFREGHCNLVAWDIQQVAYLLRLGVALRYVPRELASSTLTSLQREARMNYASWKDYSISALVGMGLRGTIDLEDVGDWHYIARSHRVFLSARSTLIAKAPEWGAPSDWSDIEPAIRLFAFGTPSTAFDPFL